MLDKLLKEIKILKEKAAFADSCCDQLEDRMYHAEDNTWWRRVGNCWRAADPPKYWAWFENQ